MTALSPARATARKVFTRLVLAEALDHVEAMEARGYTAGEIVAELVMLHGGRTMFRPDNNQLRCGGVTGNCTWSKSAGLIASWKRNAERRLQKAGERREAACA